MRRPRRARLRPIAWTLAVLLLTVGALGAVVLHQNTYDFDEQRVTIRHGGHTLEGVLTTPRDGRTRHGLVVYVHGDGPVDATHDDGYKPLWEANAEAGYASLSWDKPGVAGAPGNWLGQSMDDRADETAAAIAWARTRSDIDGDRIGLWGASQAGWVLPKVAARTRVAFVQAVSPAVNWLRQGRFNLLSELRAEGASDTRVRSEVERSDAVRALLGRRASHREYVSRLASLDLAPEVDRTPMSADRWGFVSRNHTADATRDLRHLRGIPVQLILPGHDVNVDVAETEAVYRRELPPTAAALLSVDHYPDATHTLVKRSVEQSETRTVLTALFSPRSLFADGYLDRQRDFLRNQSPRQ
ncbi:alpha/beta hydrolase [Streptomyces sp. NBC_00237]|uniref:alpha/beta hydrolase family protein n=1 Tax=Streptomyces sp. NBC_00237 TaxID=2975687 RepID=UPI002256EBAF|nr:alpha/beta hydrolase [Streptomyces sp. NBC_00237]MCX5206580.1 alpha/beta hydrolase [Streptomyces sp. NBC_00237]